MRKLAAALLIALFLAGCSSQRLNLQGLEVKVTDKRMEAKKHIVQVEHQGRTYTVDDKFLYDSLKVGDRVRVTFDEKSNKYKAIIIRNK